MWFNWKGNKNMPKLLINCIDYLDISMSLKVSYNQSNHYMKNRFLRSWLNAKPLINTWPPDGNTRKKKLGFGREKRISSPEKSNITHVIEAGETDSANFTTKKAEMTIFSNLFHNGREGSLLNLSIFDSYLIMYSLATKIVTIIMVTQKLQGIVLIFYWKRPWPTSAPKQKRNDISGV